MGNKRTDIFSHRIEAYNVGQLQYSVACENLVRNSFGRVHRRELTLKPKSEVGATEDLQRLVDKLVEIEGASCIDGGETVKYFVSSAWACRMEIERQVDSSHTSGGEEEGEEGEESCPRDRMRFIRSVDIDLNSPDVTVFERFEAAATEIGFAVLRSFEVEKGVPVTFAFPGQHGPEYYTQSFDKLPLESVVQNYTSGVIDGVREFLTLGGKTTHGLLLLSGPVGAGKSYLIRSILTELDCRHGVVCAPPSQFLIQAGLLSSVLANFRRSMIVLEDVGEVVAVDSPVQYMDARANLLNFTEGLLSLLTDAIIVLSFNYDIEKIDPAIVRPGRCLANIEIGYLPFEHVRDLVGFEVPKNRGYTLAEVYEMKRVGSADCISVGSKVGFVRPGK